MTAEICTASSTPPLLQVRGLKKYFPIKRGLLQKTVGVVKAVDGVDFELQPGKVLGLVGESGCGKSTLASLILRLQDPDEGQILFDGRDITGLSQKEMKPLRRRIQVVFQDPYGSLNPRMTVGQAIEEGLRLSPDGKGRLRRRQRVRELLSLVGLPPGVDGRYPHEFSGGQRQRIGIARALSVQPSLIICDEPVSALDVSIQAQIINLLLKLRDELNLTYLFIAHDLNVVQYVSDSFAVMYLGRLVEYGPAEAIYDDPAHPYTQALLSAAPQAQPEPGGDRRLPEPVVVDGAAPAAAPDSCKYLGRCPLAAERCRRERSEWIDMQDGRKVRCWQVEK